MPDATTSDPIVGKVIVVGKFELTPPLTDLEKDYSRRKGAIGIADVINRVYMSTTPQPITKIDTTMMSEQWSNMLRATWGGTYFKVTEDRKTYLNAGMTYTDPMTLDKAWLPGGLSFTPPVNAKAIYVGTVRYMRDDFWNITKVQVIDDYNSAKAEFEMRFGKSVRLEKALLRRND
jgi:hypothetical protein